MSVFGPSLDSSDVEAAVIAHLEAWMDTTIAATRRLKDPTGERWPNGVSPIRDFTVSHAAAEAEKWPEDQLPMLVCQSPGMEGEPYGQGDGLVSALYGIVVTAIASSVDMPDTKALARLYASAARMAILQEPSLKAGGEEPFAGGVAMVGERNVPVRRGVEAERNLMAVSVSFLVEVDAVLDVQAGIGPEGPQTAEEIEKGVIPPERPTVKEGGGSAKVDLLSAGGFFDK